MADGGKKKKKTVQMNSASIITPGRGK